MRGINKMTRSIRNSAKAIIIKDGKLLVNKNMDEGEIFFIMPGGGQEAGETLEEAVKREVKEEFAFDIEPISLEFVIEGVTGEKFHRVDLLFLCRYISEIPGVEVKGDHNQIGFEWIDVESLDQQALYPRKLRNQIKLLYQGKPTQMYLGNESMGD